MLPSRNVQHPQNKPTAPVFLLIQGGASIFLPKTLVVRFFSSVSALFGTAPTLRKEKPNDLRNCIVCVMPRLMPVSSSIIPAACDMDMGGCAFKKDSMLREQVARRLCGR